MADDRFTLTQRGYDQLQAELTALEAEQVRWRDQLQQIYSDVDRTNDEEGADFEVRTRKEAVDERIGHLKYVLERAQIAAEDPHPQQIDPGERVTVWDLGARKEYVFDLVDGEETEYDEQSISTDSPVGKALLGRRIGDTVELDVPDGWVRYCIQAVERIDA